jgi:NAD-dependent deacetylase
VIDTTLAPETMRALNQLADEIRTRPPLLAFTGAGISTESGIPDYRGPKGLWTSGSATPVTYDEFMSDQERRIAWWRGILERYVQGRERRPNAGHDALVRLERAGLLAVTITQNIDGLHREAGSSLDRLIELHGNGWTIRCTSCSTTWPVEEYLPEVETQATPPPCPLCGGILKSGVVAFGEPLPREALRTAFALAEGAGAVLVVGSTLLVNPAARVPAIAKRNGAFLAIINHGETAMDDDADLLLDAPAGPALGYLSERLLAATAT